MANKFVLIGYLKEVKDNNFICDFAFAETVKQAYEIQDEMINSDRYKYICVYLKTHLLRTK